MERRAAVIGLGYVGLTLAVALAEAGWQVLGIETAQDKVRALRAGKSPIADVSDAALRQVLNTGYLRVTDELTGIREAQAVFICVGTPLLPGGFLPDLAQIQAAARQLVPHLNSGQVIILQSTTYPGCTEEVLLPVLTSSGYRVGVDFFLAFSPERLDPGRSDYTIRNTPKVVGGVTPACTAAASRVWETIVDPGIIYPVSSARTAEMVKLLENSFRLVNISFVNELAQLCQRLDINIWEVVEAASTKPFGFMPFYPGPGVGGHCIPVDPHFLNWKASQVALPLRFISVAGEVNAGQPAFVVRSIEQTLIRDGKALCAARILALGVTFKRDVADARNSAALEVIRLLRNAGAQVSFHDPYVPMIEVSTLSGESETLHAVTLDDTVIRQSDLVVFLVPHTFYKAAHIVACARLVFDAVNATRGLTASHIHRL